MAQHRPARIACTLLPGVLLLACTDDRPPPSDTESTAATSSTTSLSACDSECSGTSTDESGLPPTVEVSGDAFAFTLPGEPYGLIDGATISILEQPVFAVTTDAMGHFTFANVPPGSTATFVLERRRLGGIGNEFGVDPRLLAARVRPRRQARARRLRPRMRSCGRPRPFERRGASSGVVMLARPSRPSTGMGIPSESSSASGDAWS